MPSTSSLRRAAALSLTLALVGCQEGPLQTVQATELKTPAVAEVLYPAREGSLLRHEALSHLPADTSWVLVADLPALLKITPFGVLFAADTEPYDELIEAASVHAVGMVLGREAKHLKTAGLDLTAPWGMASVGNSQLLFGKVTDPKALRERVHERAKKEDRDLHEKELGGGTLLEIERTHALWLVDGLAYLIQGHYGRAEETATKLSETPSDKSLASQPHFVKARDRLYFGDHAAAYVNLTPERKALSLKYEVSHLENRYAELETWLEEQASSQEPVDGETKAKIAEIEARLRHKDAEMTRLKARQARIDALPEELGVAIGIDLEEATLRGKAFLPLPKDLAADLFAAPRLTPPPSPPAEAPAPEPIATLAYWQLPLSPEAALEIATRTMGTTRTRALYRWIGGGDPPKDDPVLPLLSGTVGRSYHAVDGKSQVRLELGLGPKGATTLRTWLDRVDPNAADVPAVRNGDRLHLALEGGDLYLEVRDDAVVLAGHEGLLAAAPRHMAAEDPDPVRALALLPESDGSLSLPAASFIPSDALYGNRIEMAVPRSMSLAMLGALGGMSSRSASKKELDEERAKIEKKRKRLEKQVAKVRGELATLRARHRVEARSGRSRLLTALGTSVARVHPEKDGVTFYFAQRIAETDMAAMSEHAVYALVDSSSESETAKRIRELAKKEEDLDEQLMDLPSLAFVPASLIDAPRPDIDGTLMDVMTAGPRPSFAIGGGGTAEGLGGLGTKGIGSGASGGGVVRSGAGNGKGKPPP